MHSSWRKQADSVKPSLNVQTSFGLLFCGNEVIVRARLCGCVEVVGLVYNHGTTTKKATREL